MHSWQGSEKLLDFFRTIRSIIQKTIKIVIDLLRFDGMSVVIVKKS